MYRRQLHHRNCCQNDHNDKEREENSISRFVYCASSSRLHTTVALLGSPRSNPRIPDPENPAAMRSHQSHELVSRAHLSAL
jgi:hypothetical protein